MAFRLKASHLIALAITVGIAAWMASGTVEIGGQRENGDRTKPVAEREAERSSELFKVRYVTLMPEQREESLLVRGRTEANAVVSIRAETGGILLKRPVDKGDEVARGDIVCELDKGSREARVAQAKASLEQATLDFQSNEQLSEKGFSSEAKLRQMNASMEAAKAVLAEARLDLERTTVEANASGTVQDPVAEVGDMLKAGDVCVTLINTDPILFMGQVAERNVGRIATGMDASVELVTGETITGTVRYVASSADAQTRTFRTEIEIENPDGEIRDGLTANARIKLAPFQAYRVSPAWISLADNGDVGLKAVDADGTVSFVPVTIVAQGKDGFWINGPEPGMRVITVGQEYVIAGERVEAVADPMVKAGLEEPAKEGITR